MGAVGYICGALLIVASLIIILIVLAQDSKDQGGLSSAIGGGSNDSFFGRNSGRTKEAKLNRLTKIATVILFIATLVTNILTNV
ncbi:MAG: preprotein translocase subunit SecG [Ruminococcus sp.]|nr:preprotein translocase subunit SecG [Ruminococcus sp.]